MAFGAIVIGDEILVGKRQDKHLSFAIEALAKRGLRLAWAEYHGDDPQRLSAALERSFGRGDVVFSFGGIGATPDDHTRQCAASALGVSLALHPDAEREILARFGGEVTPQRLRMGEFPAGCEIIPNPFNRIPGFMIREHHFVPGFPQMAWPMIEWVLDERYRHLHNSHPLKEESIFVFDAGESMLSDLMYGIEAKWKKLKLFSLPTMGKDGSRGHIELGEALEVTIQVASALALAHTAGIVHRDIKPENIMLRQDGYVKILDFGLAKLTERKSELTDTEAETQIIELKTTPGMVLGTVAYMSPEQARGLPVDGRTDVWSLGVVLYEMVTGQRPFAAATPTDLIISIVGQEPEPLDRLAPSAPTQLGRIMSKALAKDREGRYHTAGDLLVNLKDLRREVELEVDASVASGRVRTPTRDVDVTSSRLLPRGLTPGRLAILATLVGALILGGFILARYFRQRSTPAISTEIKSLAVLPMVNLSGDPSEDYFADGMTDTLIAGLAKVGSLRVTSRTSVMQFKGSQKPLKEIARELNVDAIVEGSVQRFGDQVRINVQLIHAATDQHLLTQTYDRQLRDILTLQNEVARAVTQKIQIKLTPKDQVRLARAVPINPAAYDDFLRGRFYLSRQTKADNEKAIDYLNKIINEKADLRTDLQCYARLLHLIAHYELGNFDLLEYLIKSVYRYMARMENLSKVEEEVFTFLRRSFRVGAHALKPEFEKLLETLKKYERNPLETRAFSYLDIISWMESKIHHVNVQDVIREKYLLGKKDSSIKSETNNQ